MPCKGNCRPATASCSTNPCGITGSEARIAARLLAELASERNALAPLPTIPGVGVIGAALLLDLQERLPAILEGEKAAAAVMPELKAKLERLRAY